MKFRRQHPIGPYVLDFYCPAARTGIEIDGMAHDMADNPARDHARDEWLKGEGIHIIHLPASEVLQDVTATADAIARACVR